MGEKNSLSGEYEVPFNYYIDVSGGFATHHKHFDNEQSGTCHVTVYKSLDKGHGSPSVEHLIRVGNILVKNTADMKLGDF